MSQAALIGLVRRHPIWRHASDAAVRRLIAVAHDRTFRAGEHILSAGQDAQALHLLVDGAARVFYPESKRRAETTVKLFGAPAAFGDAESILQAKWAECVEALTPARALIVPARAYFRLIASEPSVCFRQYWDVARRFGVAIQTERAANFASSNDRVIAVLVAYANRFGRAFDGGVLIDHPLTQDTLAQQTGAKRRTVVRTLTELYKKKLLVRQGRQYVVPSVERLVGFALLPVADMAFVSADEPWALEG